MSTTVCKIKCAVNPTYSLNFEVSLNGCKFMIEEEGAEEVRKWWFTEKMWEELKGTVEAWGDRGWPHMTEGRPNGNER